MVGSRQHTTRNVDHLQIWGSGVKGAFSVKLVVVSTFCARKACNASGLGSDVIHDRCLEPGNLARESEFRASTSFKDNVTMRWVPSG